MPKYVDADALKEAFLFEVKDVCDDTDEFDTKWGASQELIEEVIDSAPAADVEPKRKTGRWVGMQEYCQHLFDITGEIYTMSQLGISHPHCNKCWEENESRKPFCPNCGAKMDAELPKEEKED